MDLNVKGMNCGHCEAAVTRAVAGAAPQAGVVIDRKQNRVAITGATDAELVISAIRSAGFEVAATE